MFLVLFAAFTLLVYYFVAYFTAKPHPRFPPGPYRWPIWGGYLQLLVENFKFPHVAMHWMARRYKTEVLGMYMGAFPTVIACSQASVRDMLNHPNMQGRVEAFIPNSRDPDGVTRGQFFIDGHRWTEQRRFMLRNLRDFGFGTRSKHFERVMEEELRDFLDLAQSKNEEGITNAGKVTVPPAFYAYFLNLALEVFLGTRLPPALYHKLREFGYYSYRFVKSLDPTTGAINITPWVRHFAPEFSGYNDLMSSNAFIKQFIKEMVEDHNNTFMADALRDFCDTYIKEMKEKEGSDVQHWFSEEQMVMTIWDALFAATMTQSATMGFVVEFLLQYPEVQAKAQQEVDTVVGRSRLPTLDDRKNMPYTEAVLRESMRRETIAALALPHRCTEDTEFYGYVIPKDTMVLVNLWSNNMDDSAWDNPYEFKPERHLEADGSLKKKDLVLPFGLGKHVCSGETFARQNMFLLLAGMLQHFSMQLPADQPMPDERANVPGSIVTPKYFQVHMVSR